MPKQLKHHRKKGKFLESKLSDAKYDLVRREFPDWLEGIKASDGEVEMGVDLLKDYADHLGYKDPDFRGVPESMLSTTYAGSRQIYEYIRKRVGKLDEKQTPRKGLRS